MEGDDHEPPPWGQDLRGLLQELLEGVELVVDVDPEGLEGLAGRVARPAEAHGLADDLRELGGGLYGGLLPGGHDGPGDPVGLGFLPELPQ